MKNSEDSIENDFSVFMEKSLYGPDGFYTKGGGAGRSRDYLTSPEVGDLFGYIIADYIDAWYETIDNDHAIVIDAGCGPGSLVASIARKKLRNASFIEFFLVDRSPEHRRTALEKLERVSPDFTWSVHETIPGCDRPTLIITNELLDNLVFDIGTTSDVYKSFDPDHVDKPLYSAFFGISGDIDIAAGANVPKDIKDFRIPIHIGIAEWVDELLEATMEVADLSLLFFDYMKSVVEMEDGNWLRLYSNNKRIVGIDSVLDALSRGVVGDITTDVIKEDLFLLLDQAGFSKIKIDSQAPWLFSNRIDDYCLGETRSSAYDQLQNFAKGEQVDTTQSFIKERDALMDENGLGAFGVLTARREV